jgi:hypothetical protein
MTGLGQRRLSKHAWRRSLALAAVATTAVGVPATAATTSSSCRAPAGAVAVHTGATAIVYRSARTPSTTSYEACLRATGRRTDLPGAGRQRVIASFRSAGRFLAFFVTESDFHSMTGTVGVRVFDLRAGKPVKGIALSTTSREPPRQLHDLVLTAAGTAAWRETGSEDQVAARDLQGRRRVLASGPSGSISDLVLTHGTTVQWRDPSGLHRRRIDRLDG